MEIYNHIIYHEQTNLAGSSGTVGRWHAHLCFRLTRKGLIHSLEAEVLRLLRAQRGWLPQNDLPQKFGDHREAQRRSLPLIQNGNQPVLCHDRC